MDLASHPNAWRARSQANKRDRTLLALNGAGHEPSGAGRQMLLPTPVSPDRGSVAHVVDHLSSLPDQKRSIKFFLLFLGHRSPVALRSFAGRGSCPRVGAGLGRVLGDAIVK
jgi:hypothetical protein